MAIDTKRTIVFCFVAFLFAIKLPAQDSCPALNIAHIVPGANMFSPQQEVYLAEAIDASMQLDHVIIRDPALTGRMQAIVDRMARVLPSDHPQFKVALMELPTANAYSTIGGHIYVSPKLVAMVGNDDELAGVLGHEMGHLAAEHIAVSVSDGFRAVLGAKQVGDRKDVIDKWNELHNNWHRMHMSQGDVTHAEKIHEQEELQADAIGSTSSLAPGIPLILSASFSTAWRKRRARRGAFGRTFLARRRKIPSGCARW